MQSMKAEGLYMKRNPKKYLFDMLDACQFLLELTADKSIGDYNEDRVLVPPLNVNCRSSEKRCASWQPSRRSLRNASQNTIGSLGSGMFLFTVTTRSDRSQLGT